VVEARRRLGGLPGRASEALPRRDAKRLGWLGIRVALPNWLVTTSVGVGWVGGEIGKHARWALGFVSGKTWPSGGIFTVGLQWITAMGLIAGTKPPGAELVDQPHARRNLEMRAAGAVAKLVVHRRGRLKVAMGGPGRSRPCTEPPRTPGRSRQLHLGTSREHVVGRPAAAIYRWGSHQVRLSA